MTRRLDSWVVTVVCCGAVALGCESGEEPPRGAFDAPKPAVESGEPRKPKRFIDTPDPSLAVSPTIVEEESDEEEPKRDLSVELQQAIGTPAACLTDFQADEPTALRVPISATVRPSGVVIQPSVPGSGLSVRARQCLEERITLVKLEPLSDSLSQTVSTVLELDYTPPKVVASDGLAEPVLRNTKEPLPKRPELPPSGRPIQEPTSIPISSRAGRDPTGPSGRPVKGPKPRAIDGYTVDENSQEWR